MSELQFPKNPTVGQEYDFAPYRYYWDGVKWKTKGIGYNPVNALRDELEPRISNNESKVFEALRRSYAEAGLNLAEGSFEDGGTLSSENDVLLHMASGVGYSGLVGDVAAGTNPVADAGFVSRKNAYLKDKLPTKTLADFGVIGDGVADDTAALREAMDYVRVEKRSLEGVSGYRCKTSDTIYAPSLQSLSNTVDIDFRGLVILPDDNVQDVFLSGKYTAGVWSSSMDDPLMSESTFGLTLKNLIILNNNVALSAGRRAVGLKDLHQNCMLQNIVARNFELGFDIYNCFYLKSKNLTLYNSELISLPSTVGHLYRGECNLMNISHPKAVNVETGYVFDRSVTAVVMDGVSFEGQGVSVETRGEVYDLEICNSYLENVGDSRNVCFDFKSYTNVRFRNNYLKPTRAGYLFATAQLPRMTVDFDSSNSVIGVGVNNFFKNKHSQHGRIGLVNSNPSPDGLLTNTVYKAGELCRGVVIDKSVITTNAAGEVSHISKVANDIVERNYSGRTNRGFNGAVLYGFHSVTKDTVNGKCTLKTKIIYSDMQYLLLNIKIGDTVTDRHFVGTVWGGTLYNIQGQADARVTITPDSDGFVLVSIVSGITPGGFNILGGEIRLL